MKKKIIKSLYPTASIFTLLFIWKVSAVLIDADIILPPPEVVLKALFKIMFSSNFVLKLGSTLGRGLLGFLISYVSGIIVGTTAGIFPKFRGLVKPFISIIRTIPVISVILLALIWFNVDFVPVFVAFLMAFPIVAGNITEGITTVDRELIEMANIYKVPLKKQIFNIYLPSIMPFIFAGASLSLGIIWKVVVAAEVLSQPQWGVGTSLNEAKTFLITKEVFAWTLVAIFLSFITEVTFNYLNKKFRRSSSVN